MALIHCPECQKEISDQASACPHCGHPMKRPTTIEATGKKWKATQLLSALLVIVGFIIFGIIITGEPGGAPPALGLLLVFVGLIGYVARKIGAWWHHR
jgi:hypothetical protein